MPSDMAFTNADRQTLNAIYKLVQNLNKEGNLIMSALTDLQDAVTVAITDIHDNGAAVKAAVDALAAAVAAGDQAAIETQVAALKAATGSLEASTSALKAAVPSA